jgi:hypothetical protein
MELSPNADLVRATHRWLAHAAHGVSEVRVIRPAGGIAGIGFFDDEEAFVRECARANTLGNVYVGIQPRPRAMLDLARNAIRPLRQGAGRKDIACVTATVIDIDPVRPKDQPSTDGELQHAIAAAQRVTEWCAQRGLVRPRLMMSGNGVQLWFALPPTALTPDNREMVQAHMRGFEAEIRALAESDLVKVDSIHDIARIIKVIGTVSRKGVPTVERPHRVSTALDGFERVEDAALGARLMRALPAAPPATGHPPASPGLQVGEASLARRDSAGDYDWQSPVDMCAPLQRLWKEGYRDRSLAIFDMVRFFVHKGLPLAEITELILEYDRRGLQKLAGRDGPSYVRKCHEKVMATVREDGSVPPPCHSLQKMGYCGVNREPGVRCDLFDIARVRGLGGPPGGADDLAIEGEIFEDRGHYYVMSDRGKARVISSFTITPTARILLEDAREIIVGHAVTDRGDLIEDIELPLSAFRSKRDLTRHLTSVHLQWTGTDNNVQGLMRLLARQAGPLVRGTTRLGYHRLGEERFWVGPESVIGQDGVVDPAPISFVGTGVSLAGRLRYDAVGDEVFRALAFKVFELLPQVNTPQAVLPILGWFFATPFKPEVIAREGAFPLLFVWGSQGSGKSSLLTDVFWPLFGFAETKPYSATETEFALLKTLTATTSIPVFIDEYKPFDMPRHRLNSLHRYLRRVYRGETEERGRPDQTVSSYHLTAPVCVAGEARPMEAAILERILSTSLDKVTLAGNATCRAAYRDLKTLDLVVFAPRFIQFCLARDVATDLALAKDVRARLLAGREIPVRVAANITVMLLGIHLFEEFAQACGFADLPADLGAAQAVEAVLADVLEMEHGVKNPLDHFLEMLGVMATQGEIKHQTHYVFREGTLFIHLETAYDSFRAHCRRIGYEGEIVDLKALRRLVQENQRQDGYVIADGERVYFKTGGDRRRAIGIALDKTALVAAEDFPADGWSQPQARGWRGGE